MLYLPRAAIVLFVSFYVLLSWEPTGWGLSKYSQTEVEVALHGWLVS